MRERMRKGEKIGIEIEEDIKNLRDIKRRVRCGEMPKEKERGRAN